ncbi:hypothetical protein CUMW_217930 [Citrus unshiu]|uniref:Uncharacterized protein n=1 Tax=Citrus unshiu TaxID=55188 RepID=A0A2H5QCU3_CITUN|nr:hypothetical protein CUMW_217930 [Citrus unshiu]
MPDFKLAFKHFCFHPGGRAVMDEIQKNLQLDDWHMEPSRMTLHRFGKGRVERGDQVWLGAAGSGYKCASAIWRALMDINSVDHWRGNAWVDSIDKYPVKLA